MDAEQIRSQFQSSCFLQLAQPDHSSDNVGVRHQRFFVDFECDRNTTKMSAILSSPEGYWGLSSASSSVRGFTGHGSGGSEKAESRRPSDVQLSENQTQQQMIPKAEVDEDQPISNIPSSTDLANDQPAPRPRGRPPKNRSSISQKAMINLKSNRSKTGCRTCRKRKKKCDEERNITIDGVETCMPAANTVDLHLTNRGKVLLASKEISDVRAMSLQKNLCLASDGILPV